MKIARSSASSSKTRSRSSSWLELKSSSSSPRPYRARSSPSTHSSRSILALLEKTKQGVRPLARRVQEVEADADAGLCSSHPSYRATYVYGQPGQKKTDKHVQTHSHTHTRKHANTHTYTRTRTHVQTDMNTNTHTNTERERDTHAIRTGGSQSHRDRFPSHTDHHLTHQLT